jgi:hypothetical protein
VNPTLQAIWLAEEVSLEDDTGKVTVSGIFNVIELPQQVVSYDQPVTLFFALSGVHGRTDMQLCLVDLLTLEVVLTRPVRVESDDPLEITDVSVRVNTMPPSHSGSYSWELHCEGEMLGSSRLIVRTESEQ